MNKVDYLISLGLDYNLNEGYNSLISDLKGYGSLEDENYPLWLIIRSMGRSYIVEKKLKRFSENISTIIYDQFFVGNKISDIFLELQRIFKHKFKFEVIREFGSIESDNKFWRELDEKKGKIYFDCEYKIDELELKIRYNFLEYVKSILIDPPNPLLIDPPRLDIQNYNI